MLRFVLVGLIFLCFTAPTGAVAPIPAPIGEDHPGSCSDTTTSTSTQNGSDYDFAARREIRCTDDHQTVGAPVAGDVAQVWGSEEPYHVVETYLIHSRDVFVPCGSGTGVESWYWHNTTDVLDTKGSQLAPSLSSPTTGYLYLGSCHDYQWRNETSTNHSIRAYAGAYPTVWDDVETTTWAGQQNCKQGPEAVGVDGSVQSCTFRADASSYDHDVRALDGAPTHTHSEASPEPGWHCLYGPDRALAISGTGTALDGTTARLQAGYVQDWHGDCFCAGSTDAFLVAHARVSTPTTGPIGADEEEPFLPLL
ncbi:MAG: hypothetical protein QOE90_2832 [Thermoplasmata archaeon]|nr:hypothetical protein [Thermoplasmata archaeon]